MKTVSFIGGYNKIDLMLYIAKVLTLANKKVLLIDATINQRAKYIVPAINPTKTYVTEFEGFDVAVGFGSMNEIRQYLGVDDIQLEYDIAIIDIDTPEMALNFEIERNYKICFVTAFDLYSLKKGIEILSIFKKPIKITKVLFSKNLLKEENEYLDYLSLGYKVVWDKEILSFPLELGNYSVTIQNQIISRITMKKLSDHYKNSIVYLTSTIFSDDISAGEVKKLIKNIERE